MPPAALPPASDLLTHPPESGSDRDCWAHWEVPPPRAAPAPHPRGPGRPRQTTSRPRAPCCRLRSNARPLAPFLLPFAVNCYPQPCSAQPLVTSPLLLFPSLPLPGGRKRQLDTSCRLYPRSASTCSPRRSLSLRSSCEWDTPEVACR